MNVEEFMGWWDETYPDVTLRAISTFGGEVTSWQPVINRLHTKDDFLVEEPKEDA